MKFLYPKNDSLFFEERRLATFFDFFDPDKGEFPKLNDSVLLRSRRIEPKNYEKFLSFCPYAVTSLEQYKNGLFFSRIVNQLNGDFLPPYLVFDKGAVNFEMVCEELTGSVIVRDDEDHSVVVSNIKHIRNVMDGLKDVLEGTGRVVFIEHREHDAFQRFFYWRSEPVTKPPAKFPSINSPFYALDIAYKGKDFWIVNALDGQIASMGRDAKQVYKAIQKKW